MITTATPERAEELRRLVGNPAEVAARLEAARQTALLFSSGLPSLAEQFAGRWLALYEQRIIDADSLDALLDRLDRDGVPRGRALIRFMDTNQRVLIL